MRKSRILILAAVIALMLLPFEVVAKSSSSYLVYNVTGDVYVKSKGKKVTLAPRKMLKESDVLQVGDESALTLLDEKNSQMIYITSKGEGTLGSFINSAKSRTKSLTAQYFGYIWKQLYSAGGQKMMHPDTYMQATATSYRSQATDSILLASIVNMLQGSDSPEKALCSSETVIPTNLDVDFDLVACDAGDAVDAQVKGNTGCYVRVRNNTAGHVFVNVLNIDENGGKYLVLPVDEASLCAHLLVPPMSTVSFKSEPFIFNNEKMREAFVLVATKEPVDFSILMNPIRSASRSKRLATGLCRKIYEVSKQE